MKQTFARSRVEEIGLVELTGNHVHALRRRGVEVSVANAAATVLSLLTILLCMLGKMPPLMILFPALLSLTSFLTPHLAPKFFEATTLVSQTVPENTRLYRAVRELSNKLQVHPPVLTFSELPSLGAFTYGRRICITKGLVERLNDDELIAILSHELGHIKHRDPLIISGFNLLIKLFGTFAFWMIASGYGALGISCLAAVILALPFALRINREREYAADEMSRQVMGGALNLAMALTNAFTASYSKARLEHLLTHAPTLGEKVEEMFHTHPTMTNRVKALLTDQRKER